MVQITDKEEVLWEAQYNSVIGIAWRIKEENQLQKWTRLKRWTQSRMKNKLSEDGDDFY